MKVFVNLLTTARLLGILGLSRTRISKARFIAYIIVLFLTDWLDGMLARKFKVQTLYGSTMDTIADKVFSITLLLILVMKNKLYLFLLIGEIIIALINIIGFIKGKKVVSNLYGKIKMWLLSITIIFGYMNYFNILNNEIVINLLIATTVVLQISAMFGYIKSLMRQEKTRTLRKKINNIKDLKYVLFDTEYYLSTLQSI